MRVRCATSCIADTDGVAATAEAAAEEEGGGGGGAGCNAIDTAAALGTERVCDKRYAGAEDVGCRDSSCGGGTNAVDADDAVAAMSLLLLLPLDNSKYRYPSSLAGATKCVLAPSAAGAIIIICNDEDDEEDDACATPLSAIAGVCILVVSAAPPIPAPMRR